MLSQGGKALRHFFLAVEISPRLDILMRFWVSRKLYFDQTFVPCAHLAQNSALAIEFRRNQLSLFKDLGELWRITKVSIERMMHSSTCYFESSNRFVEPAET